MPLTRRSVVSLLLRAWSILILLGFVLLVLLLSYLFVITFVRVDGASMEPTLARGALVVVRREVRDYPRGAIVGLHLPTGKLVKRIIALPGESVAIEEGEVVIGGLIAREPYINSPTEGQFEFRLKEDEYLVLGDNRSDSVDSRAFGPVHRREIIGRVRAVIWPELRVF